MLDVRRFRTPEEAAILRRGLGRRGADVSVVDQVAQLDVAQREASTRAQLARSEVKRLSADVAAARRAGDMEAAERHTADSRAKGQEQADWEAKADAFAAELRDLLLDIPNVPADDAPDGGGPDDNPVVKVVGDGRTWAEHQRVPHWEIGEELGFLELERATRLSGSMFVMYRGGGARLVRALTQLALDSHADAYEEVRPPTLVRTETMVSTGHLPKFADDAYHIERDDLWAIPTAEVPLTSMHRDEVLDEADLPRRYTAYTSCYRREAGSAGRDTRGLLRSHEFDKVELMTYSTADHAAAAHADILARAEDLLSRLGLTYRVLDLCAGDLGFGSRRTFDLEVYAPGCDLWLEVSSVSWYGDFQARRGNVRYRPAGGKGTEFVHTLNGSALAWPRVWAALVESNRRADGGIDVPAALRPYLGGAEVLR